MVTYEMGDGERFLVQIEYNGAGGLVWGVFILLSPLDWDSGWVN